LWQFFLDDDYAEDEKTTEQYLRLQKKDRRRYEYFQTLERLLIIDIFTVLRFNKADADGDGKLNNEEFTDFSHPENSQRMKELVITVSHHYSVRSC